MKAQKTKRFSIYASLAILLASLAIPVHGHADESLSWLLEAAAGRFAISQSSELSEIAARTLGRPMASQADYEELLSRVRSNQIGAEDAARLNERIRALDDRLTGDVESLSDSDIAARLRPLAGDAGITLTDRAAAGELEFFPERPAQGSLASNAHEFAEGNHVGRTHLARFEFDSHAEIESAHRAQVAEVARRFGVEPPASHSYVDLIDSAFQHVRLSASVSREAALEAADKLAKFGEELEPFIKDMPKLQQKAIRFKIADAVLSTEEFKPSDFTAAETHPLTNKRVGYVHFSDYPDYVEGFVNNRAPFTTHPFRQGSGVLSARDMRDIASHNMWPLELQPHDFRHVHYALSHPRALAVYFKSARSMDPLRFTMVSAMYEGVDTVQYGHERALANYFDTQMHMDLEDAMVYLSKASHSELLRIADQLGVRSTVDSFTAQVTDWKPTYKAPYSPAGRGGHGLDADLDDMVRQFTQYAHDPAHQPELQYNRNAVAGQPPLENNDMPQHW